MAGFPNTNTVNLITTPLSPKEKNIVFELLNEVVDVNPEYWNRLSAKAINVIRNNAPDVPIILGGVQWNSVHTTYLKTALIN